MSWVSKAVRSVASKPLATIAAPVTGGIQALTGLSPGKQMAIGAGIGAGAGLLGGMAPASAGGIPGLEGGPPLVNGQIAGYGASGFSGGGLARMIPGLAGVGASIYGAEQQASAQRDANAANMDIAREQMQFSAQQAQKEMDFQERMSSTSYQRVTADMKAAGINPMLAIDNGGASSPGGAMGQSAGAHMDAVPSVVRNVVSSAQDMLRTYSDVKQGLSAANLNEAGAQKNMAEATRATAAAKNLGANTDSQEMSNYETSRRLKQEAGHDKLFGVLDAISKRLGLVNSAGSAASSLGNLIPAE